MDPSPLLPNRLPFPLPLSHPRPSSPLRGQRRGGAGERARFGGKTSPLYVWLLSLFLSGRESERASSAPSRLDLSMSSFSYWVSLSLPLLFCLSSLFLNCSFTLHLLIPFCARNFLSSRFLGIPVHATRTKLVQLSLSHHPGKKRSSGGRRSPLSPFPPWLGDSFIISFSSGLFFPSGCTSSLDSPRSLHSSSSSSSQCV